MVKQQCGYLNVCVYYSASMTTIIFRGTPHLILLRDCEIYLNMCVHVNIGFIFLICVHVSCIILHVASCLYFQYVHTCVARNAPRMVAFALLLKHGNHHETNHQAHNAPIIHEHTFGSPLTHFVFFLRFLFVCGWRGRGRFLLSPPPFARPLLPCCTVISIRKGTFLDTVTGCKLFYLLYNKCFR